MNKNIPLFFLFYACLMPQMALAQECVPVSQILWSSPEKNDVDVPSNAALILSIPLGQTILIDGSNGPLLPKEAMGYDRFIFPLSSLDTGKFNGSIELNSGGSTSKKYPFKFDISGAIVHEQPTLPTVMNIVSDETVTSSEECRLITEDLFCQTGPHQGQMTLSMASEAVAWAVRESDSQNWVIFPGSCPPSVKTTTTPEQGSCMDIIALNQAGESSELVQACVGDSFASESVLTEPQQEDTSQSGCQQSRTLPVPLAILFLMYTGWAWAYRRKKPNA